MFKVNQQKSKSNISRTIRFTENLFNILNTIASKEDISFNALVLQCCEYAVENYDKLSELEKEDKRVFL